MVLGAVAPQLAPGHGPPANYRPLYTIDELPVVVSFLSLYLNDKINKINNLGVPTNICK